MLWMEDFKLWVWSKGDINLLIHLTGTYRDNSGTTRYPMDWVSVDAFIKDTESLGFMN